MTLEVGPLLGARSSFCLLTLLSIDALRRHASRIHHGARLFLGDTNARVQPQLHFEEPLQAVIDARGLLFHGPEHNPTQKPGLS